MASETTPPTQPGDYRNDPWPCRILADFQPLTSLAQRLAVKKDEEGVIWEWANQQCLVDIDRADPRRIGWVPESFVRWGTVTRGTPITVENALPMPGSVDVAVPADESLFRATLRAFLEMLSRLSITDQALDFLLGEHKSFFGDPASANNLINTIVAGLPQTLAPSMLQGNFTVADLRDAPRITAITAQSGIYLQWYKMPGDERDAIRVGSSNNFGRREGQHRTARNDPNNQGRHYKLARRSVADRMVVLCRPPEDARMLLCVESLFVVLMGSYHEEMIRDVQGEGDVYEWAANAANATLLTRIGRQALAKTGWVTATSRLNLQGLNITTPFHDNLTADRILWIRQDGPGFVTFRRRDTTLYAQGGGVAFRVAQGWTFDVPVKHEDFKHNGALKLKSVVGVVIEILTDGRAHPRQFGRLPYVGPYSDWQECLGFAIRLEWSTPNGLKCHYIQKKKERFGAGNVPSSYLEVSSLLAAFKGISYNPMSDWRKAKALPPSRVVKLSFNNLTRTLKIETLSNYRYTAEPTSRTVAEVGEDLQT